MLSRQSSSPDTPLVFQLSSVSVYTTLGGLLNAKRSHHHVAFHQSITPRKLTKAVNELLSAKDEALLADRAYHDLESGRRFPRFCELEPLFRALVETFGVEFTDLEITAYAHLARAKIEEKQKQKEEVAEREWTTLLDTLFRIHQSKRANIRLLTEEKTEPESSGTPVEDPHSRRLRAIQTALDTEVGHLLEREEWVNRMLAYPQKDLPVKLVAVQGQIGVGKSYAQALLVQQLKAVIPDAYLIPYAFRLGQEKTPEDYLDEFLATITADLTPRANDEKQLPLQTRIERVFAEIRKRSDQKIILLLDNAQCIFPDAGEWSSAWLEFLEMFVKERHSATMYLFTRVWPGWDEHHLTYFEQSELVGLSLQASVSIWKHRGFDDVHETLLQKVCARCGGNPQLMDMLISHCKRRSFVLQAWGGDGTLSPQTNTQRLETLLAQDTMFDLTMDTKSRAVLQQALTSRLKHQSLQMLECLACSPLGLPIRLLFEEFARADESLNTLVSASALDLHMAASGRAGIIPFIREAVVQSFVGDSRREGIESRVTDFYSYWLHEMQDFRDDAEKAALVAEMVVRHLRSRQLLKAAELFISFGWLCTLFGSVARIQRVFDEVLSQDQRKKDLGEMYEAGRILFLYNLQLIAGEKVDVRARDRDFHVVRNLALTGKIALRPRTEISIAHYLMQKMLFERRFQYAYDFLEETFERISKREDVTSEDRAAFLHSKAHTLGQWSSYAVETNQLEEVERLRTECIEILTAVIDTYTLCLSRALPLQEHHYQFQIAKAWNDLAYYSRMLGRLEEAERAIIECLELKDEKNASLPNSLAVSYGEYAKVLAAKGKYKDAETKSDEAVALLQPESPSTPRNKGMLLVERAQIYEIQGRLDEAYQLAKEALPLLSGDRDTYRFEANQLCARIESIWESTIRYQLDSEWYREYHALTQYNDISKLEQAGPFSEEEERSWKEWFPYHHDPTVWEKLSRLVKQSRDREFQQSVSEGRLPSLWYPALDLDDISTHKQRFLVLQERIEQAEKNVVVRRLYTRKIEEHLLHLRLAEATYKGDLDAIRMCNETLYGRISQKEMAIALRELFTMLLRAEKHPLANEAACTVLKQLKAWNLSAADFLHYEEASMKKGDPAKVQMWSETRVSPRALRRFYEEVLDEYGFTEWHVIPSANRDATSLDLDQCILYQPTGEDAPVLSVAGLLAEEVEIHMARSVAGKQSRLALLSSGTRGYLPTEEGLAICAVDEMMEAQGLGQKAQTWIQTLAPGLAQGILTPAHSFESLFAFLLNVLLAGQLVSGHYKTVESATPVVQRMTFRRVMRTFRGVPDFKATGVCNAKDRVYLQGYREVTSALATYPKERLLVGSIGKDDLPDMEELHLLQPAIPQLHLACDPGLFERIVRFDK